MSGNEELNAKLLELVEAIYDEASKGHSTYYTYHINILEEITDMIATFWDSEESCGS